MLVNFAQGGRNGLQGGGQMAASGGTVNTDRAGPEGRVLVITIDNPPGNALTPGMRRALLQALEEAAEPGLRGVVLAAAGRNFSAATSIDAAEAPAEPGAPSLAALCAALEMLPLPVVVALSGAAVGPGAELALAAHARVATADARLIFPEVGLGLPPQGGSTQRLPRILGAAEALDVLLSARPLGAEEALALDLVDQLVEGEDPLPAAIARAAAMTGPRPSRERAEGLEDVTGWQQAVALARHEAARGVLPAPARIIDCVDAALYLPFENGLALEAVAFEDLAETPESQGLIAAAQAERRAAHLPPAIARTAPRGVSHLGLVGSGAQMAPLALVALGRGLKVSWAEADKARLAAAMQWMAERQEAELRAGRLSQAQKDADWARFGGLDAAADLARNGPAAPGLVIHAAAGPDLAVLGRLMPAVPQLVLGGAEGALGLALAPSARVSELALPDGAGPGGPEAVAMAVQLLRRLNLPPVLTGKMPIVGRRVAGAGRMALARMLALGVPRRFLETVLDGFGAPMPDLPEPETTPPMRGMTEAEVLHRWLAAQVNEGMRLLDARVARRPSDIDHLLVQGHGFPRWRGGPMHQASLRGLMVLRAEMHGWMEEDAFWLPCPLIDRMIGEGRRISELDRV
jgi:3-hydroxyacyl-CoA dehydrogenase